MRSDNVDSTGLLERSDSPLATWRFQGLTFGDTRSSLVDQIASRTQQRQARHDAWTHRIWIIEVFCLFSFFVRCGENESCLTTISFALHCLWRPIYAVWTLSQLEIWLPALWSQVWPIRSTVRKLEMRRRSLQIMKDVLQVLDQKGNCADGHKATQMAVVTMILFLMWL